MMLETLIPLIDLTHRFQQTKRSIYATGEERMENDAEHSYQLALVAWYLNEKHTLNFDTVLLLQYALVHDLVESYVGDTPNFGTLAQEMQKTKHEREEQALLQMKKEFGSFQTMTMLIDRYEKREDKEAVFIYTLDKLLGPINIYMDNGRSWHKNGVTFEMLIENKEKRIMNDPLIYEYFMELVVLLKKDKEMLFPKNI